MTAQTAPSDSATSLAESLQRGLVTYLLHTNAVSALRRPDRHPALTGAPVLNPVGDNGDPEESGEDA